MTPPDPDPESAIKVSKASTTTRKFRQNREQAQVKGGHQAPFPPDVFDMA